MTALGTALFKQWPAYLTFITSFATILIMWVSHHGIFKLVSKSDTPFLFANGLLLLLVTMVPFPASLVAQYLTTPAACTGYIYLGEEAHTQHSIWVPGVPAGDSAGVLESLCESGIVQLPVDFLGVHLL